MNDVEKIEALCAVIESLLELIQDETAADSFREEYQKIQREDPYEDERWD